jgi:SAM-dependent methyltransferase
MGPTMDSQESCYSSLNAIKADFGDIYMASDPRSYFKVLGELGYIIPEVATSVLFQLVERLIRLRGRPVTILDVGCSYGMLSAMMRYGLSIRQLHDRYQTAAVQALSPDHLASYDTHYFAGWPRSDDVRFIGLDCSAEAIAYALRVGLIEEGLVVDLETDAPNKRACSVISRVDLIVSTGAVRHVSEKTFAELLKPFPSGRAPWIASFVPRTFDYQTIAETISQHDLATERYEGVTFAQRRFRDAAEFENALRLIQARGLDPAGKEAEGVYHAELFVSRPLADIKKASLHDVVQVAGGYPMVSALEVSN